MRVEIRMTDGQVIVLDPTSRENYLRLTSALVDAPSVIVEQPDGEVQVTSRHVVTVRMRE